MKRQTLTIEHSLYIVAFLLALGLRLLRLGAEPLSDFEAGWALQAFDLSQGKAILLGTQPLYGILTGLAFFLLGSGNGLARLFPALAGSALVFMPFLGSRGLRQFRGVALMAAFGLALDPGLVAASRLAGGPIPAVTFVLLAIGFALGRSAAWTGVFAGLALLTGVPVVPGLVGLATAWGVARWLKSLGVLAPVSLELPGPLLAGIPVAFLRKAALFAGVTILLAGTGLLLVPQGIASLADTFTAYLRGWIRPSGVPVFQLVAALVFYQPLALFLGIVGAVRGWSRHEPVIQRLSLWFVITLVLTLSFPARQTVDLVWVLVPLWILAAWEFQHHLPVAESEAGAPWSGLFFASGVMVLLVVTWLSLIAGQDSMTVLVLAMVFALAFIVGMWSLKVMRYGLAWGVSASLLVGMLATMFNLTQVHSNGAKELWRITPATGEADLLLNTLEDLSRWKTGDRGALDMTIASNSVALRWLLRDFSAATFAPDFVGTGITEDKSPSVVITHHSQNIPGMPVLYRGQDFIWYNYPGWTQVLPNDWIKWLAFRQAPLVHDQLILWARTDLFPGGLLEKATLPSSPAGESELVPPPDLDSSAP